MRRRDDAGSIDWTIVVPVFIVFVIPLLLQFGFKYHARVAAKVAAREGAAAASFRGVPLDEGARVALEFVRQQAASELRAPAAHATAGRDSVRVEVSGQAVRLVPFVGLGVHASAEADRERFRPESER